MLTERAHTLRTQPGDISFPGGKREPVRRLGRGRRPARGAGGGRDRPGHHRRASAELPDDLPQPTQVRRHARARLVARARARSTRSTPSRCTGPSGRRWPTCSTRRPGSPCRTRAATAGPGFEFDGAVRVGVHGGPAVGGARFRWFDRSVGPWRRASAARPLPARGFAGRPDPDRDGRPSLMFLGLTVLDYLLILLFISYAFTGFRQGLVVSVLSLAGFLAGGALAMWLLPKAIEHWTELESSPLLRSVVLIAGVFILASGGQAIAVRARWVGCGRRLQIKPAQWFDASLGAVAVVLSAVAARLVHRRSPPRWRPGARSPRRSVSRACCATIDTRGAPGHVAAVRVVPRGARPRGLPAGVRRPREPSGSRRSPRRTPPSPRPPGCDRRRPRSSRSPVSPRPATAARRAAAGSSPASGW